MRTLIENLCIPRYGAPCKTESQAISLRTGKFEELNLSSEANPKRRRKREKSILTWLRNRTSSIDYGIMATDSSGRRHPIHVNRNDVVFRHFDVLRRGGRSWLSRLSNKDYGDHRSHVQTYYFTGDGRRRVRYTLVLIDIDCKEIGSLEGALAFARYLRDNFFPGLYLEVSTNGKGAHGYFILDKFDVGATHVNDLLLKRLQPWLRMIMCEQGFDVENVEIKGTCPVLEWGQEQRQLLGYKSGTLAKLPRIETDEQAEELRNTTTWTVADLQRLPLVADPTKPLKRNPNTSGVARSESITSKHISENELTLLDGYYREVAESLMKQHVMPTRGRSVVTVEDVAIFLMLIRFFTKNMNPDGSLPVERWRGMWRALFDAGDVGRGFCPQRFAVIRNFISSLGLIDWQDETYCVGVIDGSGERKGRACKWQASTELMEMLEVPESQEEQDMYNGERETSFIRTNITSFSESLIQQRPEQTIRPIEIQVVDLLRLTAEEIDKYIGWFSLAA